MFIKTNNHGTMLRISFMGFLSGLLMLTGCQSALDDMVALQLKKEAEALNKKGARYIAEGVRIDSVSAAGKSIRFSYTLVNVGKGDVDPATFYNTVKKDLTIAADTMAKMAFYRQNKVKVTYAYYYKDGKPLSTIIVKPWEKEQPGTGARQDNHKP